MHKFLIPLFTALIAAFSGIKAAQAVSFSVIADGLNNARGLNFSPDGSLYFTSAGTGGNSGCVPSPSAQGDNLCFGTSGAIAKIENGTVQRVLTGLPSLALPDGTQAAGPNDIQFDATGKPYVLIGYAANPSLRDSTFGNTALGKIITPNFQTNSWNSIADLAQYELTANPDGRDVISNPLDFQIDGNSLVAVDAGGNSLIKVGTDGSNLKAIATIPNQVLTNPVFPSFGSQPFDETNLPPGASDAGNGTPQQFEIQAVPTGVAKGLDGAYYVTTFTGFPFPEGGAKIYRIGTDGQATVYADGFTQLSDLTFDPQGNLYALQYANQSGWKGNFDGSLIKITPNGQRQTLLSGNGLIAPTAIAINPDGDIYITNQGGRTGLGQIIKINKTKSVPEPTSSISLLILGAAGFGLLRRKDKGKFSLITHCQQASQ